MVQSEPITDIALNTLNKNKQALIFVNTKRSAESCAEKISIKLKSNQETIELSEKVLKFLSKPTKQCKRLSKCILKGIAFHHSGLHPKQRELIENCFRTGSIKIICCTPTLAMGLDLPAFRSIIRDVKRFSSMGMVNIPVLEYLQMAGRAGRPDFDDFGEAILIANSDAEKNGLIEKYIYGEPEDIFSKLAVEPVLRVYLLSLIVSKVIRSPDDIFDYFSKTFWAFQYKDMDKLKSIISRVLKMLEKWGFIQFVDNKYYRATLIGTRVSELYLDPATAIHIIKGIENSVSTEKSLVWLHLLSDTLEMRPQLRVKTKEFEEIENKTLEYENDFLIPEPSMFDPEYCDWMNAFKTALMFDDWLEEKDEEYILEKYDCRPGETRAKLNIIDWLVYSSEELARLFGKMNLITPLKRLRLRLKHGIREELLPLIKFEGIGRARARKLFKAGVKDAGDVKKTDFEKLSSILTPKLALNLKKQVGSSGLPERLSKF